MALSVDTLVERIVALEGGFVDHPDDRGGPTKYGITAGTLSAWRGRPVDAADVRSLDPDEARRIYAELYVRRPRFDRLPEMLVWPVVEAGVLHGPARAARWLQRALDVPEDGVVGPVTIEAAYRRPPFRTLARFTAWRVRAIGDLLGRDRRQAVFAPGWLRRATEHLFMIGESA